MSNENDDFVDDLLKGLSKAEPMSDFEIRKFENLIDRHTQEFTNSTRKRGIKIPTSIVASVAIVFGAAFLLTNHNDVTRSGNGLVNSASPQSPGGSNQNGDLGVNPSITPKPQKPTSNENSQPGNTSTEVFGNSQPSTGAGGSTMIFETNLDYITDLKEIKRLVKVAQKPGSINNLDITSQQCAIKQGINKTFLAFDKGFFQEQSVRAFYSGFSKSDYKIILVDADCELVAEL